jgi:Transposase and inactivated derivatives
LYHESNESFRQEFVGKLKYLAPQQIVYIDECGIDQYLYREYARAPRGRRIVTKISGRKFKRTNIVAGLCQGKWVAPMEYAGTTDSILFEFWFENFLMNEVAKGSVIILDNATFHKKSVLPGLAQRYHCEVLFLPPYSPDLNVIEKKWAWLKRTLRSILHQFDSLDLAIENAFQVN